MPVLRIGLLSTARINGAIIGAARETKRAEVVAVASRDAAKADEYARAHGLDRSHGSYDGLLADDAVDAVYVSLPNGLHHEWTMRTLQAGKHVLCEKPYSRRPDEVEEAWRTADAAGLVVAEAFMYRHHPQTRLVRDLIQEGAVGRLRSVHAVFSFPLTNPADVRLLPELDGGALMDVGCYCVSGARLLAGEPETALATSVLAETGVDVAFHGTLRFAHDVVAQFEASFVAPSRQRLEVVGEDGVLVVGAPWRTEDARTITLRRGGDVEEVPVPLENAFRLELEDLAAAVAGERAPLLRDDALPQARALAALTRAAETGRAEPL